MNISQPVSSSIEAVDFTVLSTAEIKAISAKRIENDTTLDDLGNPTAGGLYDLALGAWDQSLYVRSSMLRVFASTC
jgi:DNA-directed RNA polymerase I subunit RPA1